MNLIASFLEGRLAFYNYLPLLVSCPLSLEKTSLYKIDDIGDWTNILKGLAYIMYDKTGPTGDVATTWTIQKI